ncbi:uncharacterized protein N7511_009343 [Penicillium nucicola]|uniref:uncharacterized protein n=1 Tax=Penicillium nucicola TaxID=1850975 RepID=UPI00254584C1|nr:uncharacterized protein N7511_009343 [Penicillium nucicola]KAJ5747647.1 hypothetical protein N7511_009343 [Penicillium nucicola]
MITVLSFVQFSISLAAFLPKRNTTITVPDGVTYSNNVICTPTSWTDIVSFFLGNYLSHAATVITFPGEPALTTTVNMIFAILFPSMGASRGMMAILGRGALQTSPLKRALQSRALCMVVRSREWDPKSSQSIRSLSILPKQCNVNEPEWWPYLKLARNKDNYEEEIKRLESYTGPFELTVCIPPWLAPEGNTYSTVPPYYKISGTCELPPGYGLAYVPSNALIEPLSAAEILRYNGQDPQNLSSTYSFAAPLMALIQIVYGSVTLFQSRGNQVDTYGYAAFGFTVVPYLIMSVVNLVGNMATHSYPSLSLVHTELMDEAIGRGGVFTGAVGKLRSEPLPVNNQFVFSGVCQRRQGPLWEFDVGKVYRHGETEPDDFFPLRTTACDIPHNLSPTSSRSPSLQENQEISRLVIVCPSCYKFEVSSSRPFPLFHTLVLSISLLPLVAIGGLSGFKAESSTVAQRVWMIVSLVFGMVIVTNAMVADYCIHGILHNPVWMKIREWNSADPRKKKLVFIDIMTFLQLSFTMCAIATPAIGHFVVVGQMLWEYGSCSQL